MEELDPTMMERYGKSIGAHRLGIKDGVAGRPAHTENRIERTLRPTLEASGRCFPRIEFHPEPRRDLVVGAGRINRPIPTRGRDGKRKPNTAPRPRVAPFEAKWMEVPGLKFPMLGTRGDGMRIECPESRQKHRNLKPAQARRRRSSASKPRPPNRAAEGSGTASTSPIVVPMTKLSNFWALLPMIRI